MRTPAPTQTTSGSIPLHQLSALSYAHLLARLPRIVPIESHHQDRLHAPDLRTTDPVGKAESFFGGVDPLEREGGAFKSGVGRGGRRDEVEAESEDLRGSLAVKKRERGKYRAEGGEKEWGRTKERRE